MITLDTGPKILFSRLLGCLALVFSKYYYSLAIFRGGIRERLEWRTGKGWNGGLGMEDWERRNR